MGMQITVTSNRLNEILGKLPDAVAQIVAKTALDIEAGGKTNAPVRTGNLRASIQASQDAPTRWVIAVGADYGIYVEMGTHKMGAQPYLTPACELVASGFADAFKALEGML